LKYVVNMTGEAIELSIDRSDSGTTVTLGDRTVTADLVRVGSSPLYSLILDGRSYEISVHGRNGGLELVLGGETYVARVLDERALRMAAASADSEDERSVEVVKAPMPGVVVGVAVAVGSEVSPGEGVVTLEAMKMENELRSEAGGVVREVHVEVGQGVSQGEALIVIE
jgi:biotin carboxyl carrier protein